jgi:hypothetical protein
LFRDDIGNYIGDVYPQLVMDKATGNFILFAVIYDNNWNEIYIAKIFDNQCNLIADIPTELAADASTFYPEFYDARIDASNTGIFVIANPMYKSGQNKKQRLRFYNSTGNLTNTIYSDTDTGDWFTQLFSISPDASVGVIAYDHRGNGGDIHYRRFNPNNGTFLDGGYVASGLTDESWCSDGAFLSANTNGNFAIAASMTTYDSNPDETLGKFYDNTGSLVASTSLGMFEDGFACGSYWGKRKVMIDNGQYIMAIKDMTYGSDCGYYYNLVGRYNASGVLINSVNSNDGCYEDNFIEAFLKMDGQGNGVYSSSSWSTISTTSEHSYP